MTAILNDMDDIGIEVLTYGSQTPNGHFMTVNILKLSQVVGGETFHQFTALPPSDHVAQFPLSLDDSLRGAKEALARKIKHAGVA